MAHEHVRRLHARAAQQRVQLVHNLMHRARVRAHIAPTHARTIIRTDTRKTRDARLHQAPFHGKIAGARFQHNGWL
jgi:hypothetical protein